MACNSIHKHEQSPMWRIGLEENEWMRNSWKESERERERKKRRRVEGQRCRTMKERITNSLNSNSTESLTRWCTKHPVLNTRGCTLCCNFQCKRGNIVCLHELRTNSRIYAEAKICIVLVLTFKRLKTVLFRTAIVATQQNGGKGHMKRCCIKSNAAVSFA